MNKIYALIVVFTLAGIAFARSVIVEKELNVTWIGHPVVSDDDPYTPTTAWLPGYIIGLREDGVVVWKKEPNE